MMKKMSTDTIVFLIVLGFTLVVAAISVSVAKWIANSDLPFWMKYWLLK